MTVDIKLQMRYWWKNAAQKWQTAKLLHKTKRFADCLFFAHLTIECLIKGLVILKTKNYAPYTHNLVILAGKAGLQTNNKIFDILKTTTTFNLTNRYPDDKFIFYKSIDKKYCDEWIKNIDQLRLWLIKKYQTKK